MGHSIFQSSLEFAGAIEGAQVVMGPHRMKKTRRGWGWRRNTGGGGRWSGRRPVRCSVWEAQYVPCQEGEQGHLQSTADRAGMYLIDRLSITSGNTTPYFQASSTFPIYISWLWCTPVMYTMICLVAVCSCYHGLAINSLYSIL